MIYVSFPNANAANFLVERLNQRNMAAQELSYSRMAFILLPQDMQLLICSNDTFDTNRSWDRRCYHPSNTLSKSDSRALPPVLYLNQELFLPFQQTHGSLALQEHADSRKYLSGLLWEDIEPAILKRIEEALQLNHNHQAA